MCIITDYNNLNGKYYRGQIRKLINEASKEGVNEIVEKLSSLLRDFPDMKIFQITVQNKIYQATRSELNGLTDEEMDEVLEYLGLNGVDPNDIYDYITNLILELIERDGYLKWNKPWMVSSEMAMNYVSEKRYRGINAVMLDLVYPQVRKKAWSSPYFLTFKQIEKLGGKIRKGAKGCRVVYFNQLYKYENANENIKIATYNRAKFISQLKKANPSILKKYSANQVADKVAIPILKYYNVFNAGDVDGIPFKEPKKNKTERFEPNEIAEAILENMPKRPPIIHKGNEAFYHPGKDSVTLPKPEHFKTTELYYSTAFHELVHSTGHKKRLNRDLSGGFGSKNYAYEELIAELGSSFLAGESGILHNHIKNTAAYLKGWAKNLTDNLKEDNRFFFRAASQAQSAADFILDRNENGDPKYLNKSPKKEAPKEVGKTVEAKKNTVKPPKKTKTASKITKEPQKITEKAKKGHKPKVGDQLALFGVKPLCNHPLVMSIIPPNTKIKEPKLFKLKGELKNLLGDIEIKPKGSIAITLDSEQGGGKTRVTFQAMEEFASAGYKCLFVSLEEHPQSNLFQKKVQEYISAENVSKINCIGELPDWYATLVELVPHYDCIFIDSWNKIAEEDRNIDFDKDLRMKFDGKMFWAIFQQTSNGQMRGGSKAAFDGDVILKVKKNEDFRKSYVFANKNRYQETPLDQLKYGIYLKRMLTKAEIYEYDEED